jgi:hypothetical protein
MKKYHNWVGAVVFGITLPTYGASIDNTCTVKSCASGDRGLTHSNKADPYYACPTRQLANYTNFVIGIAAASYELSGRLPNISDATGEPEFEGKTKDVLDGMRADAGVRTFDQAVAMCRKGADKVRVTVMNSPGTDSVIWVKDQKSGQSFWMPKIHLNKL